VFAEKRFFGFSTAAKDEGFVMESFRITNCDDEALIILRVTNYNIQNAKNMILNVKCKNQRGSWQARMLQAYGVKLRIGGGPGRPGCYKRRGTLNLLPGVEYFS
jgi:hypothetical protein